MSSNRAIDLIREHAPTISAGILTADLMFLHQELSLLNQTGIKIIHFDVMDGCFVPKMTVGPPFIKSIKTNFLKDVHLMIQDPLEKVDDYIKAGADLITVHIESSKNIHLVLKKLATMRKHNSQRHFIRGIALNPDTPVEALEPVLDDVEMIVALAVNPRVKQMSFFKDIGSKCARIKDMISASPRKILLCIDGGIKKENIAEIAKIGADLVVSGSAIFDGQAVKENAKFMLNSLKSGSKSGIK